MYESHIRYLASVFVDADSIKASAAGLPGLLERYGDTGLLPILVQEQDLGGIQPRFAFADPAGRWRVALRGRRFDVSQHAVDPPGAGMADFGSFCRQAADWLAAALDHVGRRGHRLAAVQEGWLGELDEEQLREVAGRLLVLSPTFAEHPPFEWDHRVCAAVEREFGDGREVTNTLVTVKRLGGQITTVGPDGARTVPFDRIRVDLDVNTSPNNVRARFGPDEVGAFFERSPEWHRDLEAEVSALLLGGEADG